MEQEEVTSYLDWVNSSVMNDIETDFAATFYASEKRSALEVCRFYEGKAGLDDEYKIPNINIDPEPVSTVLDVDLFSESRDPCHIFCIDQRNSYSRLHVTRELFQQLIDKYLIFDRIWDFILPFSFKTRESDIGHAPFRFRQSEPVVLKPKCAYGFRYVELNHRKGSNLENPDYDPWSVRQTAVYQQYNSSMDRIAIVLISPSKKTRKILGLAVQRCLEEKKSLNAFDLHQIIISTLHGNWRLYVRSLERLLMSQSENVTLTPVRSEDVRWTPSTDISIKFIDRQRLKQTEDKILDLKIIFESLYNTLSKLQKQCQIHCVESRCNEWDNECTCSRTVEELEEQMNEAQVNLKKVEVLHKKAQGTAHMLTDWLDYENAQVAHLNQMSLNGLIKETKEENIQMRILTERSSRDATAVKILTVITLIYLPMTVVLNFFSTQLIHVDDLGRISVISQSWWFVVVAIPLTIATFATWKLWLSYTMNAQEGKKTLRFGEGKANSRRSSIKPGVASNWMFWHRSPSKQHQRGGILENEPTRNAFDIDPESSPREHLDRKW
ncbi:hypothetical protein LCER1_G002864 [Lachnellula cervina]|uniref:CorA-like transporter domain-containing protein n=1 Tax=Lachnellula cervina TaxID=1316786 RepID=A0A7D8V0W0_9HELO|nr:hypothetical protein LCER1_G002864 [Lachnellula cervina]